MLYKREVTTEDGKINLCNLPTSKACVSPMKRFSTPRSELSGLLVLTRLVTAVLPGLVEKPEKISLFGDSECTISSMECDQHVLS